MRVRATLAALSLVTTIPFAVGVPSASAAADGCVSGVRSDFNGDGRSDAVVADPNATVAGKLAAGRIVVLYGDADGRVGEGARDVLAEGVGSVQGVPQAGDRFGFSVAAADFDCDGYTDLAVGVPYQDWGAVVDAGTAHVIWGSAAGLGRGDTSTWVLPGGFGQPARERDLFGYALDAVEDVGQGGTPEPDAYVLAIGVPGAEVGGIDNAGALAVRAPLDGGSVAHWITQETAGVPGVAEAGDFFGWSVTCNYLVGGAEIDCAVGAPGEDVGSATDAGTVAVIKDLYDTDDYTATTYDQNSPGVPGDAEKNDRYGASLDSVLVGSKSWLAVGAPGEAIGSAARAGSVQLFNSNTVTLTASTGLSQNTSGVGGTAEAGDVFGQTLAFVAPGLGDAKTRLAVGAPGENTAAGADAGIVQVFPMGSLGSDLTWTQDSAGVPGVAAAGDAFGAALATVAGVSERVLLVGVPEDTAYTTGLVNVIPFSGAPRLWAPGLGGVAAAGAVRFGAAIAGVDGGAE